MENHFRTFSATVVAVGRSTKLAIDFRRQADAIVGSPLKLDGASGCGVTVYREEFRIFVKL